MQDEFVIFVHKSSIQEMSFSADFEEENLDLELRKVHLIKEIKENERKKGLVLVKNSTQIPCHISMQGQI